MSAQASSRACAFRPVRVRCELEAELGWPPLGAQVKEQQAPAWVEPALCRALGAGQQSVEVNIFYTGKNQFFAFTPAGVISCWSPGALQWCPGPLQHAPHRMVAQPLVCSSAQLAKPCEML